MKYGAAILAVSLWCTSAGAQVEEQNIPRAPKPAAPRKQPQLTKPPELVDYVSPEYPPELFAEGIAGEAVLLIDVGADGKVANATVSRVSHPAFAEPALVAGRKLTFTPAEIDGTPAPIRIEYRFVFEPVVIEPDAIVGAPSEVRADQSPVNYRGLVRQAVARKPIEGATVMIGGRPVAVTNDQGVFEVRGAPTGKFEVRISAQNYKVYWVDEERADNELIEGKYYLLPLENNPYETVVTTRAPKREVSKVELKRGEVEKSPGTFGDPLRVIENLPGMGRAFGGFGGQLIVRGANPEDTRVYVDGIEVPFLYHFGGLTSIIQAQFLDHIDFYPGGFGAKYGRSTAGIVDVGTRLLDCDGFHGRGKVDLIDSAYYSCHPLGGGWTLGVAARRSYIDLFIPLIQDAFTDSADEGSATISPRYLDYQLKASKVLGRNTFEIFMFGSADDLSFSQSGSLEDVNFSFGLDQYFNRTMFRHRYKLGETASLTSQVTGGFTRLQFSGESEELDLENRLKVDYPTFEWREQLDVKLSEQVSLSAGLDHLFGSAKVFLNAPLDNRIRTYPSPVFDFADTSRLETRLGNYSQGYWAEAQITPGAGLKIIPGFRFERIDFYRSQGYEYMPRLNVRWQALEGTSFKAAFGLYAKLPEPRYFTQTIGNPFLKTERSTQYVAGVEQKITELINVDVQGFYTLRSRLRQDASGLVETEEGVQSLIFDNGGRGHTIGLQLLLRHELEPGGRFFGWVSYTLSRSVVTDSSIDFFEDNDTATDDGLLRERRDTFTYLSDFDQTHILTVVGQWVLGKGWEVGFRFRLTSGNPYTPLNRGRVGFDADRDVYYVNIDGVGRNSGRLPIFHQLDVRVDRTWTYSLVKIGLYLDILNVYNHRNTEQYSYDYRYRGVAPLRTIPFFPNLGVQVNW
ncbi:MAG TPA: TonB-dependent receptor [Myxococcota bacterium]|nr:TonB-dependent receptor [Myxococcota bacterium]